MILYFVKEPSTRVIRPVKGTSHFLPQSTVSCSSGSSSEANFDCEHKSVA